MPLKLSRISGVSAGPLGIPGIAKKDPFETSTVLKLSTLGSANYETGYNTFVDESSNNATITRVGDTYPSSFSPYGDSWSNYFDGTGDYLSVADSAALEIGSGDFTVETWVYLTGYSTDASFITTVCQKDSSYALYINGTSNSFTGVSFAIFDTAWRGITGTTALNLNQWYHIAATRTGTAARVFVNGQLLQTNASYNYAAGDNTNPLYIGSTTGTQRYLAGYISNLRIVKGTALYTSDFTSSKTPLTAVSGTSLLTCCSNNFNDYSSNNFSISAAGNVAVKPTGPFGEMKKYARNPDGWSTTFNGSTQYLQTPSASPTNGLQLGTSNFTIECWIKASPQSNYARVLDSCAYGNTNIAFALGTPIAGVSSDLTFGIYTGAALNYDGFTLTNVLNNSWNHVAIVRSSNNVYGYVNGILVGSVAIRQSNQNLNYTTPLTVGVVKSPSAASYSNYFSGKISNLLITKQALYLSNFKPSNYPPRSQIFGIPSTLILCQAPSIKDSSDSYYTIVSAGSPAVTNDSPFLSVDERLGSSYFLDGSVDSLTVSDSSTVELGDGDFTIEAWICPRGYNLVDSGNQYQSMLAFKDLSYGLYLDGTSSSFSSVGLVYYDTSWKGAIGAGFNFKLNEWHHVAFSKQNTTMRAFIDGKLISTATNTFPAANNANQLRIGGQAQTGYLRYFNGHIADFRICTSTAIYTSNFNVPTRPITSDANTSLLVKGRPGVFDLKRRNSFAAYNGSSTAGFININNKENAIAFDGSADMLYAPNTGDLDFGTGDFTIETWVNLTGLAPPNSAGNREAAIINTYNTSASNNGWGLHLLGSPTQTGTGILLEAQTSSVYTNVSVNTTIPQNTWTHISVVRKSGLVSFYVNGAKVGSSQSFTSQVNSNGATWYYVGYTPVSGYTRDFSGYMHDLTVVQQAKYDGNFTVRQRAGTMNENFIRRGLITWYRPFNKDSYPGSGGTIYDLSGYSLHGTLNTYSYDDSEAAGSIQFNQGYISLGNSATHRAQTLTFGMMLYRANWNDGETRWLLSNAQSGGYGMGYDANGVWAYWRRGTAYTEATRVKPSTSGWHYFTFSYDGRYKRTYLDGVLTSQVDLGSSASIGYASATLFFGAESAGSTTDNSGTYPKWNGKLGELQIYNVVLTPEEVAQNFAHLKERFGL